ncbi:MAG: PTS sugar transporter subunit IIC [Lachnospiraceae bacterium]|jgi:PTS system mannose-specific IIC component|uniref:PTS mannose/fructose/sorbose/N-acetylgalactosamine transporter subunit IIC n=1 Tax=Candidatus Merdisoma sp. JLR.KK006 TaxID=3112626 RepID=UPI002FF01A12|nr:PTS sugar transporter subunit IIC [Lachnospiraceae bacterium]
MNIFQAILIALFGYLSSNYSPWVFGQLGGWYTMGRPLVSGLIIGIILGDVQTGILMGAAVQTLYIGLVTPGLSMPADLNFAAWMGIPLAMVAGADTEYALGLAVPLSFLGVSLVYVVASVNVFWVRKQEQWIAEGKIKKASNVPIYASVVQFIARFVPIFLACYFGQEFITNLVAAIPTWLGDAFVSFGKVLPAVGFAMLLRFVLKKNIELLYFLIGFLMIKVLGMPIIAATIAACFLGFLDIRYGSSDGKNGEMEVEEDE